MKANIYLTFNGNCEAAFNRYKEIFGVEYKELSRFGEMPETDGQPKMPEAEKNRVMHATLPLGNGDLLMGSDTGGEWASNFVAGTNFSISLDVETREKANELFEKLSHNGNITMPMNETFWGSYFGMCVDEFGVSWMISTQ